MNFAEMDVLLERRVVRIWTDDEGMIREILEDITKGLVPESLTEIKIEYRPDQECNIEFYVDVANKAKKIVEDRMKPVSTDKVAGIIAKMRLIGAYPLVTDGETVVGYDSIHNKLLIGGNGESYSEKITESRYYPQYGIDVLWIGGEFTVRVIECSDQSELFKEAYSMLAYQKLREIGWFNNGCMCYIEDDMIKSELFLESNFRPIK